MDALIFSAGNDRSSFFSSMDNESKPAHWRKIQHPIAAAILLTLFSAQYCAAEPIPRTQIKSFDAPGATETQPIDINNSLTIIGQSRGAENTSFVYRNGIRETTSPDRIYYGINNQGQIVGAESRQTPDGNSSGIAFVKTADNVVDLNISSEVGNIFPVDINNNGVMIGKSGDHVFMAKDDAVYLFFEDWEDTDPRDEGGVHGTWLYSINDHDVIVGSYIVNGGREHGFIYDSKNPGVKIVDHPSGEESEPRGINNWGLIVGNHHPDDESSQGFAYFDGKFIAVEVGKVSTTVTGVNDWGFITGSYRDAWGENEHGFVAHILPFIFWDQIN